MALFNNLFGVCSILIAIAAMLQLMPPTLNTVLLLFILSFLPSLLANKHIKQRLTGADHCTSGNIIFYKMKFCRENGIELYSCVVMSSGFITYFLGSIINNVEGAMQPLYWVSFVAFNIGMIGAHTAVNRLFLDPSDFD